MGIVPHGANGWYRGNGGLRKRVQEEETRKWLETAEQETKVPSPGPEEKSKPDVSARRSGEGHIGPHQANEDDAIEYWITNILRLLAAGIYFLCR